MQENLRLPLLTLMDQKFEPHRYGSFGDLGSNKRFPRTYELTTSELLEGLTDSLESYAPYVAVYNNSKRCKITPPVGMYTKEQVLNKVHRS